MSMMVAVMMKIIGAFEMVLLFLSKKKVKSSVAACGFPCIPGDSEVAAAAGAGKHKI